MAIETDLPTASWPRRMVALFIDWVVSSLVIVPFVPGHQPARQLLGPHSLAESGLPTGGYVLESAILTWLLGGSFGKLCTGLRVLPADGVPRPISPLVLIIRQVLVILVIPPLVFRPNGRGLHDLMAGTSTVSVATFEAALHPTGKRSR